MVGMKMIIIIFLCLYIIGFCGWIGYLLGCVVGAIYRNAVKNFKDEKIQD